MRPFIIFFILFYLVLSQEKDSIIINNLIVLKDKTKIRSFEMELYNRIVKFYNSKNKIKIKLKYIFTNEFNEIRPLMLKLHGEGKLVSSISSFTISSIPKFEYSYPYLPVRDSFISLNSFSKTKNQTIKCAYHDNKYTFNVLQKSKKQNKYLLIPYKTRQKIQEDLNHGKIHLYFGDSHDAFFNNNLKIVEYLNKKPQFLGIIFPRKSKIKKILNPTIKYFTKSNAYYPLLKKYLGKDISSYVRKTINDY